MAEDESITRDQAVGELIPAADAFFAQLDPEDQEILRDIQHENAEQAKLSDEPWSIFGLQSIGFTPQSVEATVILGKQLFRQGLIDKARDYFLSLVQYERFNWQVLQMLGIIEHHRKQYGSARSYYLAAEAWHEDGLTKLYLGESEIHLGHAEEGLAQVRASIPLLQADPRLRPYVKRAEAVVAASLAKNG